jgi:hypothetical protein
MTRRIWIYVCKWNLPDVDSSDYEHANPSATSGVDGAVIRQNAFEEKGRAFLC